MNSGKRVRIGIVGLGANTRLRHVPGFQELDNVELVSVCNRSPESTKAAADEFGIPKVFASWNELVADDDIDAVMIGTWPYLHCPITLAALEAGKHVLTEARMARDLREARAMLTAANRHPELITQIVPSPFGLRAGAVVKQSLDTGSIGELLEFRVVGRNADFANRDAPLHWRQQSRLSGLNMLALGILHETLMRWIPDPVRVCASTKIFDQRGDRPDSVQVTTETSGGARGLYDLSGVAHHGGGFRIELYGTKGTIHYRLSEDRLLMGDASDSNLREINVPDEMVDGWRVESDFVAAIRGGPKPTLTDFAAGVRYMEFTEAVERSALELRPIALPLQI